MKKMKNKKSHELRFKNILNKNTNPEEKKKKNPFKTEFSSKSLIHMISSWFSF